jgi:MerR family transcriptional regulator/heat shock protein HspR
MGVNLAGVEIILNMREKMAAMQKQIEEFVRILNSEVAARLRQSEPQIQTSLIPVVQAAVAPQKATRKKAEKASSR